MYSLEFILIFSILLTTLALFSGVIQTHTIATERAHHSLSEKWFLLTCSSRADAASHHFVLVPAQACASYPYAHSPPSSPFLRVLGGDANHYD